MQELYWSKSNHLLSNGDTDLKHFPTPSFQFGSAKKDVSLTKRERRRLGLGPGSKLPALSQGASKKRVFGIGKHRPRGATRHSDPIHLATLNGEHALMRTLIGGNTVKDIDVRDSNMATALHIACEQNDLEAVTILVNAGAALNLNDYETPLHCAVRMDHTDIVRFLIRKNASLETKSTEGVDALKLSLRKIVMNDKFAHGILRPITVENEILDYDGTKRDGGGSSNKKKNKNKKKVEEKKEQMYEKMRTMSTWDHGDQLIYDASLEKKKKSKRTKVVAFSFKK